MTPPGASATSAVVSVTVGAASRRACPTGQIAADVGSPAVTGQTSYSSGTYTVRGGGMDIWDPSDQFRFVYASNR